MFDRTLAAVRRALPEHVFAWHRPDGVTTIRIGTRTQVVALAGAALLAAWTGIAATHLVAARSTAAHQSIEVARMQARLAALTSTTAALKGEVAGRAAAIEKRQAFLAALLSPQGDPRRLAALLPRAADLPPPHADLAAVGEAVLAPFRKLEADQFAFVDRAASAADARLRTVQAVVRRLGLDPDRLVAASAFTPVALAAPGGVGGPYLPVAAPADAEPRFRDLLVTWRRLQALEAALAGVPAALPVATATYSSGFGVRTDPFTGLGAMHAGVDLLGRQGEPIYAAATGTVDLAGWAGAYGNCVEVVHGRGLASRYGHLSQILVRPGQVVHQGDVIARMGSTGRSTGTHLHFEVRVDGRAVDPRPYLDASGYFGTAQRAAGGGGAVTDAF